MSQSQIIAQEEASQSSDVLLQSILQHERTFRNTEWEKEIFDEAGATKLNFLEDRMRELDVQLHELAVAGQAAGPVSKRKLAPGMLGATPVEQATDTLFRFDEETYRVFYDAKDEDIKKTMLRLIKRLQNLEEDLKTGNFDTSTARKYISLGTAFSGACALYTGGTTLYAVMMLPVAMGAITSGAALAAFAAVAVVLALVIAALITLVLIMLKNATEVHLVLNNTDYELRLYDVYCNHGKEVARPKDKHDKCIIPRRATVEIQDYSGEKHNERVVYGGFFGFSKKEGALFGANGVVQFDMYNTNGQKHQESTFLAYQVPLTSTFFSGGGNSCYVRCSDGNPSAEEFFNRHTKDLDGEHWEWTDSKGNIKLRKRIHNRSGSECFAITTYEQV